MSQVVCVVGRPAHHVCQVFQDPATAIVEVAVHKTFEVLDTVPHVLTCVGLLSIHPFVLIPSTVSRSSWNRIVSPSEAAGRYQLLEQKAFALDTHLHRR